MNEAIRNLNAVLHWATRNRFVSPGLEVRKIKVARKPVTALSPQQVRDLLTAASRYSTLRLRVLPAVTTGLRRGDIETIRIGDIHFDPYRIGCDHQTELRSPLGHRKTAMKGRVEATGCQCLFFVLRDGHPARG